MPRRGLELTSSWSGVRRSNQIASWPVELVFISGGFYNILTSQGDENQASILREEDAEEAEGYFEHLLRGQGEAMTDGEDYFDQIVGEIEDLIIDERFLQLQSGRGNVFHHK